MFLVAQIRPEAKWANHEHVFFNIIIKNKTAPTTVAKVGDDLWLGVKGLSKVEIACYSRNLFK